MSSTNTTSEKAVGKYGAMIQKARKLESQQTSKPDLAEEEVKETGNPDISLSLSPQTRIPENQKTGKPARQKAGKPDVTPETIEREEEVNLSIKVPKRLRRHWVAEAKRRDSSLTAIIIGYLKEELGEPSGL